MQKERTSQISRKLLLMISSIKIVMQPIHPRLILIVTLSKICVLGFKMSTRIKLTGKENKMVIGKQELAQVNFISTNVIC